jgi:crossover junction endodeoxyribonuclease RusA
MIAIDLPWPPQATSANGSQGKFRAKATAAKGYKETCAWMIRAAKVKPCGFAPVSVSVTFNPPAKTNRFDLDNLLGRAKQGLDAVAEAIGVDDSQWQEMRLLRGKKGGLGSITVHVAPWVEDAHVLELRGAIS